MTFWLNKKKFPSFLQDLAGREMKTTLEYAEPGNLRVSGEKKQNVKEFV